MEATISARRAVSAGTSSSARPPFRRSGARVEDARGGYPLTWSSRLHGSNQSLGVRQRRLSLCLCGGHSVRALGRHRFAHRREGPSVPAHAPLVSMVRIRRARIASGVSRVRVCPAKLAARAVSGAARNFCSGSRGSALTLHANVCAVAVRVGRGRLCATPCREGVRFKPATPGHISKKTA
jgi:hypothetical protein